MTADALVYHPTYAHLLKYFATTVGRDKLLRTVQYFSRFYAWYLYRTNNPQSGITPWETAKKQIGIARKFLRLGKFLEHFKSAAVAADKKDIDPILKFCAVGRQLGYAGYLSLDNLCVLDASGIRKWDKAKQISRQAARFWFSGLFFNIVAGLYTLFQLKQRAAALDKTQAEKAVESKKIEKEWNATTLQLTSDLADICVPATTLGWTNFDDGFVGLAGTLSSLLGVYSAWKKTA
ncbi:uncharacterized protein PV09_04662 [Verruconis gallopava]|uniref:Peroxisomal biogenesis factor 11 n=1 Tax=Verruconis gallopava TaxID=253628 RepID=A0A0D2AC01_9PEZI|nr:uncharacterized protein PV09_04662 [Verruconis gallopava]KIW04378.1 hypothetical protein PV09_04662 [Verruconis gallopava]